MCPRLSATVCHALGNQISIGIMLSNTNNTHPLLLHEDLQQDPLFSFSTFLSRKHSAKLVCGKIMSPVMHLNEGTFDF